MKQEKNCSKLGTEDNKLLIRVIYPGQAWDLCPNSSHWSHPDLNVSGERERKKGGGKASVLWYEYTVCQPTMAVSIKTIEDHYHMTIWSLILKIRFIKYKFVLSNKFFKQTQLLPLLCSLATFFFFFFSSESAASMYHMECNRVHVLSPTSGLGNKRTIQKVREDHGFGYIFKETC